MANAKVCLKEAGVAVSRAEELSGMKLTDDNAQEVIRRAKKGAKQKARDDLANIQANTLIARDIERMTSGENPMKARDAVKSLLVRDLRDRSGRVGVDHLANGINARLNGKLAEVAEAFAPGVTGGIRNSDLMNDAVRVALGGQAKNAKGNELGTAIRQVLKEAHELYERAGGDIGFLPDYYPQTHMANKLRTAKLSQWKEDVKGLIDPERMLDDLGEPLDAKSLDEMLDYIYASITTHGAANAKPPKKVSKRWNQKTATRNNMSRVLHFKDADAFLKYNAKYGNHDLWGVLTNHVHSMSVDIALHKTFGADVESGFQRWKKYAQDADQGFDVTSLDAIWDNIIGFDYRGQVPAAQILNAGRDILSSAYMGSAVISSIPDLALLALNASLNDMGMMGTLASVMRYSEADRKILNRTLGHIEYANSAIAQSLRFEETLGTGWARRASDINYRVSGMTGWVNRLRHAWMGEFATMLGDQAGKSFDQLSPSTKTFLETYGLVDDWDLIRAADLEDYHGSKLLNVNSLKDDDLASRLLGAIYTERDLAVLHPDARVRAALNQGLPPGTLGGEVFRGALQFQTFPATMIMHAAFRYFASNRLSTASKWGYTMGGLATMTMLGAVAVQLKELVQGRDPREQNAEFWADAFMQGGAVPIIGDLILRQETRHGRGPLEAAFGPSGGAIATVGGIVKGGVWDMGVMGESYEDTNIGFRLEQLSKMVPGSNVWWAREFIYGELRDWLLGAADPTYNERQRSKAEKREDERDQGEYWGIDGKRMPDLHNVFETSLELTE